MTDDFHRYIEHLQGKTLSDGFEDIYDLSRLKEWVRRNDRTLKGTLEGQCFSDQDASVRQFEQVVREFQPSTRFELPFTHAIFDPLLDRVRTAAARRGLDLQRPVRTATSTDVSASPLARPSGSTHLLFIGLGTSSFCNYWAKVFTALILAMAREHPKGRIASVKDLLDLGKKWPMPIVLATRLCLYHAFRGTLIGFGRVNPPPKSLSYRLQLIEAMELFALGHEFGHFFAEERLPQFQGALELERAKELELFCDRVGIVLSRECSEETNNFLAFSGAGAIVLFRASQMCEATRGILLKRSLVNSSDGPTAHAHRSADSTSRHPSFDERLDALKAQVVNTTAGDQIDGTRRFVTEFDMIAQSLNSLVLQFFEEASAGCNRSR